MSLIGGMEPISNKPVATRSQEETRWRVKLPHCDFGAVGSWGTFTLAYRTIGSGSCLVGAPQCGAGYRLSNVALLA